MFQQHHTSIWSLFNSTNELKCTTESYEVCYHQDSNSSSLFVSHEQWQIAWLVWCATWMPLTFGLFLFKLTGGGRQQSRESCPLNITEHAGSCWVLHPGRGCPVWIGNPWVVTVVTVYDIGTDPWCIFWEEKWGEMRWLHNLLQTLAWLPNTTHHTALTHHPACIIIKLCVIYIWKEQINQI